MIAYYQKRSQGEEFEQLKKPLKNGFWLNGSELSSDELEKLAHENELDANIVYDLKDLQELPRVEFKESDAYIFMRTPHLTKSGHVVGAPLLCILRSNSFFTLSMGETYSPEAIVATTLPSTTTHTTDMLLGVIASCISSYQTLLKHTERSINDTGAKLKTHEVTNQDFIHFVTVEDNLTMYRMNLSNMLSVVSRLKDTTHPLFRDDSSEALDDISLHIQQLLAAVQSYSGRVESIRSAYSTIANNTLNHRMKTLTVFTVLITVPNVFYGMFGMNVLLPFSGDNALAYPLIVFSTIVLTFLVYVIAKRLRLF